AVDSPAIRKAIEAVYSVYLPKNSHPWVYLSLEMDPKTVHFMNEEEIINTICDAIQERLGDANLSRNFLTQTLLPQSSQLNPNDLSSSSSKKSAPKLYEYDQVRTDSRAQTLDSFLVSTTPFSASDSPTPKRQRLDIESGQDADGDEDLSLADISMITVEGDDVNDISADQDLKSGSLLSKISLYRNDPLSQGIAGSRNHGRILGSSQTQLASSRASPSVSSASGTPSETLSRGTSKPRRARIDVKLTSVLQLREEVKKEAHPVLTQIFANHTFVGILDNQRGLIQNELALYLVNYEFVSEELFYQICLRDFSNFGFIRLSKPAPIKEMVLMALDDEQDLIEQTEWPETLKSKEEIAETVEKLLVSRRDMLREYFSICVTEKGEITAIPLMIRGYVPNLENLPDFLWRLGSEVDWTSEKACFQTISRELAIFYMTQPECVKETPQETTQQSNTDQGENESNQGGNKDNDKSKDGRTGSASSHSSPQAIQDVQFQHLISSVIFPALKRGFHPPRSLIERTGVVVQVAQVKDLYKVFERC
ncbi:DNA mismatch repair protein, partial [Lunasporangiospora selenospora]